MRAASAQQGRNRMLFKAGKVSIITYTLPAFLHIMLDLLGFLYPFRRFYAIWVEICDRRNLESLPFSADFRYLGRDLRPAATGISTFFRDFRYLGRDLRPTELGISTLLAGLRYLGREMRPTELGISTLFGRFPLFG